MKSNFGLDLKVILNYFSCLFLIIFPERFFEQEVLPFNVTLLTFLSPHLELISSENAFIYQWLLEL